MRNIHFLCFRVNQENCMKCVYLPYRPTPSIIQVSSDYTMTVVLKIDLLHDVVSGSIITPCINRFYSEKP